MYITRISVRNDGPLKEFEFQTNPPFSQPRPIIITGPNGAGKTNLISILADAIIEGAAAHHPDVTTHSSGLARNWFRVVGGATQRAQTDGSYAIVEFDDGDSPLQFVQKAGSIESPTSDTHRNQITPSQPWVKDGAPLKQFYIDQETSQRIYSKGVYAFFPVSRSEKPHWLNSESLKGDSFTQKPKYTGMFGRHIYIEHPTEPL
ncbi:hypothetical protein, partial [Luteococcus sp.]|uniref:hypothetical protein n=1 Tax=Luteococcus sp. TaxID=1969402 RepID=UPI003734F8E7